MFLPQHRKKKIFFLNSFNNTPNFKQNIDIKFFKKVNKTNQGFTPTPFKKKGVSLETRRGFTPLVDFGIIPTVVGTGQSPMPKFTTGSIEMLQKILMLNWF